MKKLWDYFCNILFPEHCKLCERPGNLVCSPCLSRAYDPFEKANILAVFKYQNPGIQAILWAQKFHGNTRVAQRVAPYLYDTLLGKVSEETVHYGSEYETKKILLIPVPLSKKRERQRGYNQAQRLTRAIERFDRGSTFEENTHILAKNRETIPQTQTKSKTERLKNLHGCFSVMTQTPLKGSVIVLIDDITTTGATFHEAEKTLREAGAEKVICLAVAH